MAPFKSPDEDGFYLNIWDIVGESLFKFTTVFFGSGKLPEGTNNALLTLLPKVTHLEQLKHLRPISLFNVAYKVITKTMTNRLKGIMSSVVSPNHSSFVLGQLIVDNILIYQEALHSMGK